MSENVHVVTTLPAKHHFNPKLAAGVVLAIAIGVGVMAVQKAKSASDGDTAETSAA
jgi:hypothetical protein